MTRYSTRRDFLAAASLAAASATLRGSRLSALSRPSSDAGLQSSFLQLGSPELKALALQALDAARSAGAVYADVQIRSTRTQQWNVFASFMGSYPYPLEKLVRGIGVRALVNGYWGFAGVTGVPTPDVMATLGRNAAAHAKIAATGKPRRAELAATPVVRDGTWATPVKIDPFTVHADEKIDFCESLRRTLGQQRYTNDVLIALEFVKEERTFASTDGSYTSQTCHTSGGMCRIEVEYALDNEYSGTWLYSGLTPTGAGWEYIIQSPFAEQLPAVVAQAFQTRRTPKPVNVGRYDVVYDAATVARLLDRTVGSATELDRAMGYEANGVGTSFLNDPPAMLGAYQIGSPLVTITANRSLPQGVATVGWDDEGVAPVETTLVKQGIVTDFQTTREAASWLAPAYQQRGIAMRSNGCAGAETPTTPVSQVPPNFALAPGAQSMTFLDLVRDTKRGFAVMEGDGDIDQQSLNGSTRGFVREIKDGVLGDVVGGATFLFRTPELWKNVIALGGASAVEHIGIKRGRQRGSGACHTVSAVPIAVTGVAVTSGNR